MAVVYDKVYNLSGTSKDSIPHFLKNSKAATKSSKQNEEHENAKKRLELIQGFAFPSSCEKVAMSADGLWIGAIGLYPPEVQIFDTANLTLHCSRRFDSEPVDFLFLSDDYKKMVFLHKSRILEFHAQGGRHAKFRIPQEGRCLSFSKDSAQLDIVGSSENVYRLDLSQGAFQEPLVSSCTHLNFSTRNPSLPLTLAGGAAGIVNAWDNRIAGTKPVSTIRVTTDEDDATPTGDPAEVTCGSFSSDGLKFCAGTSNGVVRVFDIRSSRCIAERDHRNDLPIVQCQVLPKTTTTSTPLDYGRESDDSLFLHINNTSELTIVSADRKGLKIWNTSTDTTGSSLSPYSSTPRNLFGGGANIHTQTSSTSTKLVASVDCPAPVNGFCSVPASGLIFVAQETSRIGSYFVPAIGIAPKWCSFLESLTEELEEAVRTGVIYDDYRFVTLQQLQYVGAEKIIGTKLAVPHMHGFLVEAKLYNKFKSLSEPFAAEKYHKEQLQKKLEAKRSMRVHLRSATPKVNADLVAKLLQVNAKGKPIKKGKSRSAASLLQDDRFGDLFKDPNFTIENV
eukprot:Lankesteria_metandrocarpae@DN174_c0_g1_i1.p1